MKMYGILFVVIMMSFASAQAQSRFSYRDQIDLPKAWQITRGSEDVKVAVMTTGVNYLLSELDGKVERDPATGAYGYNFAEENQLPLDDHGIGTCEATLISGEDYGIAPDSRLIVAKSLSHNGGGDLVNIGRSVDYAIQRGAKIIQFGLGVSSIRQGDYLCEIVEKAADAGALIVISAGNNAKELIDDFFPGACGFDNTIVVASTKDGQTLARFSSWSSKYVHIAAPGVKTPCVDHNDEVKKRSGTLISAAVTTGTAALVWSHHPEYSAQDVKEALIRGAKHVKDLTGKVKANGVLNAYGALTVEL